ncbi:phosphatidylserine decarboxylase-domain-containing protein [Boeremia exigua]|uniref:phosphatidylserine decarboxylase-domain-containing protein n=1 Tax=Boeremia exigua TaxID=749465 RepID=UPI001E8E36C0|nr:phosphatidylserine decarboxylase-domain-containing protein [Boeremia exigua]KAH6644741.1 phosphatidylserine decarboxylase-domain-containing protein [Boeremia exigua]
MASPCARQLLRAPMRRPACPSAFARTPRTPPSRTFSSSRPLHEQQQKESFRGRLGAALGKTKIKWEPIPIALGVGFLGAFQLYRIQRREKHTQAEQDVDQQVDQQGRPAPRERIRPSGPWTVQVMSTLPLKALSRLWGRFNEVDIPYYLRVPGFKLYSFIFGVNLDEVAEPDLHVYPNLAAFFYRKLKPGARPLDPNPNAVLSPADGKVIQFGTIEHGEVEQVKGVTYSLDALLGSSRPSPEVRSEHAHTPPEHPDAVRADQEFARVNGISYTLPNLFSGPAHKDGEPAQPPTDQSTPARPASEAAVRAELAAAPNTPWWSPSHPAPSALYYIVIYLAPGDYHRFHSPVPWIVSSRRHFAGELYSVSPYLQRTLPGLFTLNERVVLLGRWRWGFFSYTPVGATNVGSIKIAFDKELRTNSLTTDTAADRAAAAAKARGETYTGFSEASYRAGVLGGRALQRGEEMGGFQLGSTIVLVFEAPKGERPSLDQGFRGGKEERKGGFEWCVEQGGKVKVGEALGFVREE